MIWVILACVAVACISLLLIARWRGYVYVGRTAAGLTTVHDDTHVMGERIRVLDVMGSYQSATYLDERWADPVFAYHRLFDHAFDEWPSLTPPTSCAVLGGGGYAIPKHLIVHHPYLKTVDVVEIDPAIERIARRFFFLDRIERSSKADGAGRLRLHTGDARAWLEACGQRFDIIINDCFFGVRPEGTLMTDDAARLIRDHLAPEGRYLTNVVSSLEGSEAAPLYAVLEALTSQFAYVGVYPCGADEPQLPNNNVVVATNANHPFEGAWVWPVPERTC